MVNYLVEALIIGIVSAIIGFTISTLLMYARDKDFSFDKYTFWPWVFFSYFLTGIIAHLLFQWFGANNNIPIQWIEDGNSGGTSFGPLERFKLIINGQDRMKEQSGKYFNQVQPYYHHTGNPYPGIYSYSFALKPEQHQPSGTCNFSRVDNSQVAITLKSGVSANSYLEIFAVNYNVLRIQSGMGGLAFSN
jgi:hypothetical protein